MIGINYFVFYYETSLSNYLSYSWADIWHFTVNLIFYILKLFAVWVDNIVGARCALICEWELSPTLGTGLRLYIFVFVIISIWRLPGLLLSLGHFLLLGLVRIFLEDARSNIRWTHTGCRFLSWRHFLIIFNSRSSIAKAIRVKAIPNVSRRIIFLLMAVVFKLVLSRLTKIAFVLSLWIHVWLLPKLIISIFIELISQLLIFSLEIIIILF